MHPLIPKISGITGKPLIEMIPVEPDPLLQLMRYQKDTCKYLLQDGELVGLNLANIGLTDAQWSAIRALEGFDLRRLQALNLSDNALTGFVLEEVFEELVWLNLSDNAEISSFHINRAISSLKHVDLSWCALTSLSLPAGLDALHWFSASHNQLKSAVFQGNYPQLEILNLRKNELTEFGLPAGASRLRIIDLSENESIASPPVEIVTQGSTSILNWYAATKKSLNEVKVLIIGEPEVGKTSLLRRLKNNGFSKTEPQTDGVIIEPFDFANLDTFKDQKNLHGIKAYFWDFGGQDILKSTHQFFMTKRSVYLLLLNARSDQGIDAQIRNWMAQIKRLGENSPVLLVINKIDVNPGFGFNYSEISRDFPQIKAKIEVSCDTGKNLDELRYLLEIWLPQAELFNTLIDEKWINIKEDLQQETQKGHYLHYNAFQAICNKHQLENESQQKNAVDFLNDLGIVLHFDQLNLNEYYVLDPFWVTYGVYRIITSPKASISKGYVLIEDLMFIINDEKRKEGEYKSSVQPKQKYGPADVNYLASIMSEFKLSFFTEDENPAILIPDLLDGDTPMDKIAPFNELEDKISLVYDYGDELPAHTITNFIVERNEERLSVWRSGIILECKGNIHAKAVVMTESKRIRLIVTGENHNKSEYLTILRYCLDKINRKNKAEPILKIPLPGFSNHFADYDVLIGQRSDGIKYYTEYKIEGKPKFEIEKLLFGIKSTDEVAKMGEEHRFEKYNSSPTKQKKNLMVLIPKSSGKNPINFNTETRRIKDAYQIGKLREDFNDPIIETDVKIEEFITKVIAKRPYILHITTHATADQGLIFGDEHGKPIHLSPEELKRFFEGFKIGNYRPELCVISACNSIELAKAILPFCNAVVGMNGFLPDEAAWVYAEHLYSNIFNGNNISGSHYVAKMMLERDKLSLDNPELLLKDMPILLPNETI